MQASAIAALLGSGAGVVAGVFVLRADPPGLVIVHLGMTMLFANFSRRYRTPPGQMAAFTLGRRAVAMSWPHLMLGATGMQAGVQFRF